MKACCPTCGRTIPAAKTRPMLTTDTATMTNEQLYAYYKRTAPLEDVRFLLRVQLSLQLRTRVMALENAIVAGMARADAYRAYVVLQDAWRAESNARERESGEPAIGSDAWRAALLAEMETETAAA